MKKLKNPNLLRKMRQDSLRAQADQILRGSKADSKPQNIVAKAKAKVKDGSTTITAGHEFAFENILRVVQSESDLLETPKYMPALHRLAYWHEKFIRPIDEWKPRSHNLRRQFSSLARHLFCKYEVPFFMDTAWFSNETQRKEQEWFIHIGMGNNIRKAENLPIPLTKMMAHHFLQAPDDFTVKEAIRFGQVVGMGGSERLAKAICGSFLRDFSAEMRRPENAPILKMDETPTDWFNYREEFWQTVINFMILNDNMLDMNQVAPIIDYINNQKFVPVGRVAVNGTFQTLGPPQPGFSMQKRTMDTLVVQVEAWHARLAKIKDGGDLVWPSCGIKNFERVEGEIGKQRRFVIEELLSSVDLKTEGTKMHHCVYSYSRSCSAGRSAIYSLKTDTGAGLERRATIEVIPNIKQITQVRGKYNVSSTELDQRVLRMWCMQEGLSFGRSALTRWA